MKIRLLIAIIIIFNIAIVKSQTDEKKSGFYDFKLSYVYSSKGSHGDYFIKNETLIPYGLGLSCTYKFNKRIYSELGFAYKTEGEKIEKGIVHSDPAGSYSGDIYHKYTYSYIDLPLQLHYNILKFKSINIFTSCGFKGTIFIYDDYWNPYFNGKEYDVNGRKIRIAYYFGLMEYFDLTSKIGVFASQNYGYYLNNKNNRYAFSVSHSNNLKTFDIKIGISYKIKR